MEDYGKLKDKLCRELEEFARKEGIDPYDLETIHKLTDTVKNIFGISSIKNDNTKAPPYTVTYTIYEKVLLFRACTITYFCTLQKVFV